ncbi:MAG: FHA domain-containing protein [Thermoanaerobaculum sp.]|nr:FHA domain-containing protein [Thermoanaerobaculum sp.]MDW7968266.1 FHA domain-containing protein [Thermoanaerobaculum sp.]
MLKELEAIDTSPIEQLQTLKAEQLTLKERLDRMGAMKDKVSPEVYARVRKDYEGRLAALEAQARPLLDQARKEYARLKAVIAELERKLQAARLAKEEVEFRNALGEYSQSQFAELLAQAEGEVAEFQGHLAEAAALRQKFVEAVLEEKELEAAFPFPPAPAPREELPPPPPPATVDATEATALQPMPGEETGATIALAMPRLVVQTPEGVSQEFQLKAQVTTIGRSPRNDICIAEASVSRQHAEIYLSARGYTIRDLGSNNGVFVNGHKVVEQLLASGDTIELGAPGWKLTFLAPD